MVSSKYSIFHLFYHPSDENCKNFKKKHTAWFGVLFMSETVQDTIWYLRFQMPCSIGFQHFIRKFIDSLIIKSPPRTNLATLTPNLENSFPLNLRSPWTVLAYCICISFSIFFFLPPSSLASVMVIFIFCSTVIVSNWQIRTSLKQIKCERRWAKHNVVSVNGVTVKERISWLKWTSVGT